MTHLTHIALHSDRTLLVHSPTAHQPDQYRSTATHSTTPTVNHAHAVTRHTDADTGDAIDALLCCRIHWSIHQTDTI